MGKNGQHRYRCIVLGRDKSRFVKGHSDSVKTCFETDVTKMLQFLIVTIFVMLGGCVFQQIVDIHLGTNCAPFLAYFSFIRMRHTSYRGFSRKNKRSWADPLVSWSAMSFHLHQSNWAWNEEYHIHSYVYFIPRSTHRDWQWGPGKNEPLRQKRWFHFSYCELSIYM